jgi:hypothetical protein
MNKAVANSENRGKDVVGAVGMRPKSACKTWIATEYVTGGSVIGGQGCGEDTEKAPNR